MEPRLRAHLNATFFAEYQALRTDLMPILSDADLAFSAGGTNPTLGERCREIGEIEHAYVESFRTFTTDFDWRHPDPAIAGSVAALTAWFIDLDDRLDAALEALSEQDILERRIVRGDFPEDFFSPYVPVQLDTYREALLIFCGKVSVVLRALGRDLPGNWPDWIG